MRLFSSQAKRLADQYFVQEVDGNPVLRELSDETLLNLIQSKMWTPSSKSRL